MHQKSLAQLADDLRSRRVSATELTQHLLARIERFGGALNGFVTVTADQALAQAAIADRRIARGEAAPLTGVPIAHKDIFCTAGVKTSCGSRMLDNFIAPYDATVVERLRDGGRRHARQDEHGRVRHGLVERERAATDPCAIRGITMRVPGGSSGGSAAAVAARLVAAATGTDTGGSIRQPAALCGHHRPQADLRPRVALRHGRVRFEPGPGRRVAHTAEDAALLLEAMAGFDRARLDVSSTTPCRDTRRARPRRSNGLTIGRAARSSSTPGSTPALRLRCARRSPSSRSSARRLNEHRAADHIDSSVPSYYVVAPAEASSNLARFDGVRFGHRAKHAEGPARDLYCAIAAKASAPRSSAAS